MNTRSTVVYPTPPPTSNQLDSHQRARLVKSTRKLGAMLGATPQLIEVDAKPNPIPISFKPATTKTKGHRRHGSIFDAFPEISPLSLSADVEVSLTPELEPRSSVDVLPIPKSFSSNPRRSADAPRPLILRLNTPICSSSQPATPDSAATIKFSEYADAMLTPTPATPRAPSSAELRRKKMAKLTRTLGESIPPELVFNTAPKSSSVRPPTPRTQRNMSVDRSAEKDAFARSSRIWLTGAQSWQGAWNRRDIREVQKQLRTLKAR